MQGQRNDGTAAGDDISSLYQEQTMIALGIYSFLDNLLSALRHGRRSTTADNEILIGYDDTPAPPQTDVKPGGHPEEMFVYLSENDKEKYECSICYNILKDAHQCRNNHRFCYSCIYVWSSTPGGGSDRCPMCREDGLYARNAEINEKLNRKRVKCLNNSECNWRGYLREYESHVHRQYTTSEINEHLQLPNIDAKQRSIVKSSIKVPSHQARRISDISVGQASEAISTSEFINQNISSSNNIVAQNTSSTDTVQTLTESSVNATNNHAQASILTNESISNGNNRSQTQTGHVPLRRGTIRPRHIVGSTPSTATVNNRVRTNNVSAPRRNSVSRNNNASGITSSSSSLPSEQNAPAHEHNHSINNTETTGSLGSSVTQLINIPRPPATPRPKTQRPRILPSQRSANTSTIDNNAITNSTNVSLIAQESVEVESNQVEVISNSVNVQEITPQAELEYVRLRQPPSRPPNLVSQRLREGREQLGLLMSLFSLQLNERQQAIDRYQLHHREREQRRLQQLYEVQTLNRRLTQVASNLGSLLDRDSSRSATTVNNAEQSSDETSDSN